jgi:hypothetical protein
MANQGKDRNDSTKRDQSRQGGDTSNSSRQQQPGSQKQNVQNQDTEDVQDLRNQPSQGSSSSSNAGKQDTSKNRGMGNEQDVQRTQHGQQESDRLEDSELDNNDDQSNLRRDTGRDQSSGR